MTASGSGGNLSPVYRIQDVSGRGPFRPGFSKNWADENFGVGVESLPTIMEDFGEAIIRSLKLRAARNCLYWPAGNKGFLGLASDGPQSGARVGPAADVELRDITCVAEVTDAAVVAWEKAPWK